MNQPEAAVALEMPGLAPLSEYEEAYMANDDGM
jgi:hypothetical protein